MRFAHELVEGRHGLVGRGGGYGGSGGHFRYSIDSVVVGGEQKPTLMELVKRVDATMVKRLTMQLVTGGEELNMGLKRY